MLLRCTKQRLAALRQLKKMDAMLKEYENLYEEMAEAKAEGGAGGYGEKLLGCRCWGCLAVASSISSV